MAAQCPPIDEGTVSYNTSAVLHAYQEYSLDIAPHLLIGVDSYDIPTHSFLDLTRVSAGDAIIFSSDEINDPCEALANEETEFAFSLCEHIATMAFYGYRVRRLPSFREGSLWRPVGAPPGSYDALHSLVKALDFKAAFATSDYVALYERNDAAIRMKFPTANVSALEEHCLFSIGAQDIIEIKIVFEIIANYTEWKFIRIDHMIGV